jgi:hypothetical protein
MDDEAKRSSARSRGEFIRNAWTGVPRFAGRVKAASRARGDFVLISVGRVVIEFSKACPMFSLMELEFSAYDRVIDRLADERGKRSLSSGRRSRAKRD